MGADLLPCLGGAEDSHDRDLGALRGLGRAHIFAKLRVETRGRGLIVIDAVQPHPENVHILRGRSIVLVDTLERGFVDETRDAAMEVGTRVVAYRYGTSIVLYVSMVQLSAVPSIAAGNSTWAELT